MKRIINRLNLKVMKNVKSFKSSDTLQKGDIVWAKERAKHVHPIVYLGEFDVKDEFGQDCFKACILSTKLVGNNKKMEANHFMPNQSVPSDKNNQYLVTDTSFSKKDDWIDYIDAKSVVGRLTIEGIAFVEKHLPKKVISFDKPIWEYKDE